MNAPINYTRLGLAERAYGKLGYEQRDLPWLVPEKAILMTLPGGSAPDSLERRLRQIAETWKRDEEQLSLLGSAEQAFVHEMMTDTDLEVGTKYYAITPCFRDEPVLDRLHRRHFMKLELFQQLPSHASNLDAACAVGDMIEASIQVMTQVTCSGYYDTRVELQQVATPDGVDLEIAGIEVGSYGYRRTNGLLWAYGTGLAEPRMSEALEVLRQSRLSSR